LYRSSNNIKNSRAFNLISSVFFGSVVTIICLIVFSFVMTKIDAPDGLISAMSSISICVGSYFVGFLISKKRRKNGLFTGIFCGILIFCITFLISIIFVKNALSMGFFSKFIMILICSSIGGIVGVNSKVKRY